MRTIWLIRHAESLSNAGERVQSTASAGLSPKGQLQAQRLAAAFPTAPDKIIVSSYVRTRETAGPLLARYPECVVEEWPVHEFTFLRPSLYDGTTQEDRIPAVTEYWAKGDPTHCDGDGAESFSCFIERVGTFTERLHSLEGGFTAIFAHGRFITGFLWQFLAARSGSSAKSMKGFLGFGDALLVQNASVYPVYFSGATLRLGAPWHAPYASPLPLLD